jgi:lysine 2,3-aminomutase
MQVSTVSQVLESVPNTADDETPPPRTLKSLADLSGAGLLAEPPSAALDAVAARYAIAITPAMAALIDPSNPDDPIGRQFLPSAHELTATPGESGDPIGDARHEKVPGLIHRYHDRVLLKLTHVCPVYCRFCFRREMVGPGGAQMLDGAALDASLRYIAARPEIFEVILTGGDPLMLAPRRIAEITRALAAIPHVQVLRWHSRVPVVAPERVTRALADALMVGGKAVYIGVHTNHVRELTAAARAALGRLADAGLVLLSQTVLLRGINDTPEALAELMRALLALRVRPYYLHQMDAAPGTAHFRTTIDEGQALMRALRGHLSGLAQPTYVLDIPGGVAKVPILPTYLEADGHVRSPDGAVHPISDRA